MSERTPRPSPIEGLWSQNPALVQLLGLCPLLAVSTTAIGALGLGVATAVTLVLASATVAVLRAGIPRAVRLPIFVLCIATIVTAVDLTMRAWLFDLHERLGLFVPLIVTNCVVLARLEVFASREPLTRAICDALGTGAGFTGAILALGLLRELAGTGCVLAGADLLAPVAADALRICIDSGSGGLLLAVLPPGAFLGLALLIVAHRYAGGVGLRVGGAGRRSTSGGDV